MPCFALPSAPIAGLWRPREKAGVLNLYTLLREEGQEHDPALRSLLGRVLVSPNFLYRIEQPAAGVDPQPVSSWELASRLSYFLWSSMPDGELFRLAAAGSLRDPQVLARQAGRMLKHERIRALALGVRRPVAGIPGIRPGPGQERAPVSDFCPPACRYV